MEKPQAIVFDLDGTAIPNNRHGMPSERLRSVVNSVKEDIHLIAASGRTLAEARPVVEALGLTTPFVCTGGSLVVDAVSGQILRKAQFSPVQVASIARTAAAHGYKAVPTHDGDDVLNFCVSHIPEGEIDGFVTELKTIDGVMASKTFGWSGAFTSHVVPIDGTKEDGVGFVFEHLGIDRQQTIGVGDGDNDIHLFAATGHGAAMGNAGPNLKAVANEVLGTIDEDGLAQLIERWA